MSEPGKPDFWRFVKKTPDAADPVSAGVAYSEEARRMRSELAEQQRKREVEASRVSAWRERVRKTVQVSRWEKAWNADRTDAVQAVDAWLVGGTQRHLFLFGGVGSGKTTAAGHAAKAWLESQYNAVSWLTPDQLVSAVLHSYDESSPKLHRYVVIDDMGRERKPEFADALCDLLDRPGHVLLVTSNLTTQQFKERYTDARLLSRLNDCCVAVRIKTPSMRATDGGF